MSNNCNSCPCDKNPCDPSGAAARLKCSTYARITRRVRMPMSLFLSRRSAFSISQRKMLQSGSTGVPRDSFSGPSDRSIPSVNPITGKVGVDKKHNSYARFLGRLKGPIFRDQMAYGPRDLSLPTPSLLCGDTCAC